MKSLYIRHRRGSHDQRNCLTKKAYLSFVEQWPMKTQHSFTWTECWSHTIRMREVQIKQNEIVKLTKLLAHTCWRFTKRIMIDWNFWMSLTSATKTGFVLMAYNNNCFSYAHGDYVIILICWYFTKSDHVFLKRRDIVLRRQIM